MGRVGVRLTFSSYTHSVSFSSFPPFPLAFLAAFLSLLVRFRLLLLVCSRTPSAMSRSVDWMAGVASSGTMEPRWMPGG